MGSFEALAVNILCEVDNFNLIINPLSANVVHARHYADVTGKIIKNGLSVLKEEKICYKMECYTLCLGSVDRQKSLWKVRI